MSILIEKGTKMITKFAIKVHEVITDTKTGHSNEYQPTYFFKGC